MQIEYSKFLSLIAMIFSLLVVTTNGYAKTSIINIYDANGNLVTGDGRYYEYNDANQFARVRQGDQTGPVIAEYFYDSAGQRIKKIENGVITYYVGKHFEKQVGWSNAGNTSYYFGEGGERVAKKDPAGNIFYYHLDHLDGINVVTDSPSGTSVSRTDYLPFGDVRAGSSGSEKYTYTGKEKDKTDLYYFNARYNSPEFRHFTQADIAEPDYADPQDLNRYAYVGNNPLSYVDEDGFKKKKKAKLSKREKWMIAHGSDPDHDKTPLKKAKKMLKEGKKYAIPSRPYLTVNKNSNYDKVEPSPSLEMKENHEIFSNGRIHIESETDEILKNGINELLQGSLKTSLKTQLSNCTGKNNYKKTHPDDKFNIRGIKAPISAEDFGNYYCSYTSTAVFGSYGYTFTTIGGLIYAWKDLDLWDSKRDREMIRKGFYDAP